MILWSRARRDDLRQTSRRFHLLEDGQSDSEHNGVGDKQARDRREWNERRPPLVPYLRNAGEPRGDQPDGDQFDRRWQIQRDLLQGDGESDPRSDQHDGYRRGSNQTPCRRTFTRRESSHARAQSRQSAGAAGNT